MRGRSSGKTGPPERYPCFTRVSGGANIKTCINFARKHQTLCLVLQLQAASSRATSTDRLHGYPTAYYYERNAASVARGLPEPRWLVVPPRPQPGRKSLRGTIWSLWQGPHMRLHDFTTRGAAHEVSVDRMLQRTHQPRLRVGPCAAHGDVSLYDPGCQVTWSAPRYWGLLTWSAPRCKLPGWP